MNWLKDEKFYLLVMLLLILLIAVRTPLDSDMWWHLRAGQTTWQQKGVLQRDIFSYTRFGEDWVNHSWLSQLVMYGLYALGKFPALSLWVGLTAMVAMYVVYLQTEGAIFIRIASVFLSAFVSSVVWSPRPQLFSILMFALTGWVLFRYRQGQRNSLIYLLPIFLLWSNLHGGYVLGIILILTQIAGLLLNQLTAEEDQVEQGWQDLKRLSAWFAGCLLVVLINPNGISMWRIPFQTVGVETLQDYITEWASPDFHQPVQQVLLILLFGLYSAAAFSRRRLDGRDLMSVAVFGISALVARRNFGPFALTAAPVLSRHLDDIYREYRQILTLKSPGLRRFFEFQKQSEKSLPSLLRTILNSILVVLLLFGTATKWLKVSGQNFMDRVIPQYFPAQAASWIEENQPQGRMFNSYNWGGYLIWRLSHTPVFVDGRTDLFGDPVIKDWLSVVKVETEWEQVIEKWQINWVLIEPDQPLAEVLACSGWDRIYQDETAVIYLRNSPDVER